MDLVFKRYSSPFLLIDTLIANNQFCDFILDLLDTINEEKVYELWMHKVFDKEYEDFRKQFSYLKNRNQVTEKVDVDKVLQDSMSVLDEIKI